MIYGDNPQKINQREDKLGLKTYTTIPQITAVMQAGNLYVYGINNPVSYVDSEGQSIIAAIAAFVIANPELAAAILTAGYFGLRWLSQKTLELIESLLKSSSDKKLQKAAQTATKATAAVAAPAAPDPEDDKNQNSYYKKGLREIEDDWIEVESDEYNVKSESFKNFLKEQGYGLKGWKK